MTDRADIEMAFVRILSTDGVILSSAGISAEDKRERIRLAILQKGVKDKPFDACMTFGEAFAMCYQRTVEMRRLQRDMHARPMLGTRVQPRGPGDDDDDAGDEDEDEGAKRSNTAA